MPKKLKRVVEVLVANWLGDGQAADTYKCFDADISGGAGGGD